MSRLGVALIEAVEAGPGLPPDPDTVLRALDLWCERAGKAPSWFPVWARRNIEGYIAPRLFTDIRIRGIEPIVFLEVDFWEDIALRLLAARVGDGTVIRINQEPNGRWGAPWQAWGPERFVDSFQRIAAVLHSEADIQTFYCPQGRGAKAIAELDLYYPGDEAVDVVGFDRYSRSDALRPVAEEWKPSLDWARSKGKPIIVGETGREAGLKRRADWLRQVGDIDVDGVVVMDMLVDIPEKGIRDDWRWNRSMYAAWEEMA